MVPAPTHSQPAGPAGPGQPGPRAGGPTTQRIWWRITGWYHIMIRKLNENIWPALELLNGQELLVIDT